MQCHQKTILHEGVLHFSFNNAICSITCKNYLEQNGGFTTNFKSRFRIHKSDIKNNKDRCGTVNHFNGMCKNDNNIFEQVYGNARDIDEIL